MFFSELEELTKEAVRIWGAIFPLKEQTPNQYVQMHYPKVIPVMKFETHQYRTEGFGNVTTFTTDGMGGRMKLATMVFTPFEGAEVPLLLLDCMVMPKKERAVCFVEFYDCTKTGGKKIEELLRLNEKYNEYPDYAEKEVWYVKERTPYSLIKSELPGLDGEGIRHMVIDAVTAYAAAAVHAPRGQGDAEALRRFQERMIKEGNPSSSVLEKVLGKQGAADFFKQVILPVPMKETKENA